MRAVPVQNVGDGNYGLDQVSVNLDAGYRMKANADDCLRSKGYASHTVENPQ